MTGSTNGISDGPKGEKPIHYDLDVNRLVLNLASELKPIPPPESLVFGETKTDNMLVSHYDPVNGWSAPEIKPYGSLSIEPSSSCLQYSTNIFEGMKAYLGADGQVRLFRPQRNMERMARSAGRVALPKFDQAALLTLIKRLVLIEKRWIPTKPGYSLYIRPTMIGTRTGLGVRYSDTATLCIFLSPTGPYFKNGLHPISLLAISETARTWPGGTGSYKLALNYTPGFVPQIDAAAQGYDQLLWLLESDSQADEKGKKDLKITEVGAMNVCIVVKRDDGDLDLITPELDGTILPGVTRLSALALADAHTRGDFVLPKVPSTLRIHTHEIPLTMSMLTRLSSENKVLEFFGVGTAAIVAPVGRIGWQGKDILFPGDPKGKDGLGLIGRGIYEAITGIQTGRLQFEDWSVLCE